MERHSDSTRGNYKRWFFYSGQYRTERSGISRGNESIGRDSGLGERNVERDRDAAAPTADEASHWFDFGMHEAKFQLICSMYSQVVGRDLRNSLSHSVVW